MPGCSMLLRIRVNKIFRSHLWATTSSEASFRKSSPSRRESPFYSTLSVDVAAEENVVSLSAKRDVKSFRGNGISRFRFLAVCAVQPSKGARQNSGLNSRARETRAHTSLE